MKQETLFECSGCGAQSQKWSGRCLECGKWGTIAEENSAQVQSRKSKVQSQAAKTTSFAEVRGHEVQRLATNISEVDRVLGGGIVPGSLILLGGEPGIGKSTIILQIAQAVSQSHNSSVKPPLTPPLQGGEGGRSRRGDPPLNVRGGEGALSKTVRSFSGEESAEQI
ncbi:MAG: DnaB-like helicase C-terminal domain-containing protein, partial [bacterium]|nr:DnaB-like helicase C-terminal domain-containing protein [bacterium]